MLVADLITMTPYPVPSGYGYRKYIRKHICLDTRKTVPVSPFWSRQADNEREVISALHKLIGQRIVDIAKQTSMSDDQVRKTLNNLLKTGVVVKDGYMWRLK